MTLNISCPSYPVLSIVGACTWRKGLSYRSFYILLYNWKRDFSYCYV